MSSASIWWIDYFKPIFKYIYTIYNNPYMLLLDIYNNDREEKFKLLKKASKDPLFHSDIDEITSVFEDSDRKFYKP